MRKTKYVTSKRRKESRGEELRKRYGNRTAFEWLVRLKDEEVLRAARDYTDAHAKRITAFVVANTVILSGLLVQIMKRRESDE